MYQNETQNQVLVVLFFVFITPKTRRFIRSFHMLNSQTLNSAPLNSAGMQYTGGTGVLDSIIFDGFGLQNENIVTAEANFWNNPKVDLQSYRNPKTDGGAVIDKFYSERDITISGTIYGYSYDDLNTRIDTLKKALSKKEGYLDVLFNGAYRRIKATVTNTDIISRKHYDITRCKFSISFHAVEPFRYNKDLEYKMWENVSTNISEDITNLGSIYSEPLINILFKPTTTVTQVIISIGTKQITITHAITASDILEIDSINKVVKLNNIEIDYTGGFPIVQPGVNIITTNITGTYVADIVVLQRKNWL